MMIASFQKILLVLIVAFVGGLPSSYADGSIPWPFDSEYNCPMSWKGVYKKVWKLEEDGKTFYFDVDEVRKVAEGRIVEVIKYLKVKNRKIMVAYGRSYIPDGQDMIAVLMLNMDRTLLSGGLFDGWVFIAYTSKYPKSSIEEKDMDEKDMCRSGNTRMQFLIQNHTQSEGGLLDRDY